MKNSEDGITQMVFTRVSEDKLHQLVILVHDGHRRTFYRLYEQSEGCLWSWCMDETDLNDIIGQIDGWTELC